MRRWIVILLMWRLCSLMYAENINVYKYQLWFDQDRKGEIIGILDQNATDTVNMTLDASILPQGLHTLYYRVKDKAGNWSALSSWLFYATQMHSDSLKLGDAEYWIDKGYDHRTSVTGNQGSYSFVIDAASLSEGLHTLYYRAKDSYGRCSSTNSRMFLRRALKDTSIVNVAKKLEYWFDADDKNVYTQPMDSNNIVVSISTTGLTEGLHTLYYRVKDKADNWSALSSWLFYSTQMHSDSLKLGDAEYWIDKGYDHRTSETGNQGSYSFVIDAASLSEGLHTLYYRAKDSYGRYSSTNSWMFLRRALKDTSIVNVAKKLEYWFDADNKYIYTQPMDSNNIAVSISSTGLTEGLHTLNYRVQDNFGIYSSPGTWMFFKQSGAKPTRISKYRYWWNEQTDKAVIQTVNSDSTNFVFSAQLIIPDYAKTDGFSSKSTARLSVMFCDDAGNWSQVITAEIKYPDVIPPVSEIHADKEQATDHVTLTWNVTHDEVQDYNVYVAEDDQPYVLWIPNTSKTTAVFKGQPNTTYKFTVTARDISNNSEVLNENKFVKVEFKNNDQ
jgi:hypothetical protein